MFIKSRDNLLLCPFAILYNPGGNDRHRPDLARVKSIIFQPYCGAGAFHG